MFHRKHIHVAYLIKGDHKRNAMGPFLCEIVASIA